MQVHQIDEPCSGYKYRRHDLPPSHAYLWPEVTKIFAAEGLTNRAPPATIFDLGCGNGSIASELTRAGFMVTGVDPSVEGIEQAKTHYPHIKLERGSAYDDLASVYGTFDALVSFEVMPLIFYPRLYAKTVQGMVKKGGIALITTAYHGYWKNLALALVGRLDDHFQTLTEHGYVKFWSVNTLRTLLMEAGFWSVEFRYAGRFWPISKTMIAIARR
jgi:2-polyprenyl-3-methyl-5-hydroxy-6-metoxy-1,4-benzoquinol methylase